MLDTRWSPTDESEKLGVVIYQFSADKPYLTLSLGDTVHILERCREWYRGFCTKDRQRKGLFPCSHVFILPSTVVNVGPNEFTYNKFPISEEISSTLREFLDIWMQLYERSEWPLFENLKTLMTELMDLRQKLLSGSLDPGQEKSLVLTSAYKIDHGKRMLGLDMVLRDTSGNVVDGQSICMVDLYMKHMESQNRGDMFVLGKTLKRPAQRSETGPRTSNFQLPPIVGGQLHLVLHNVDIKFMDKCELLFGLFDEKKGFITEQYSVHLEKGQESGNLMTGSAIGCVFSDLGITDIQIDKLFLVCQMIRIGRMNLKNSETRKYSKNVRRPIGVALLLVNDLISGRMDSDSSDYTMPLYLYCEGDSLFKTIMSALSKYPYKASNSQGLQVSMWFHAQEKHRHAKEFGSSTIVQKLGFSDVIFPDNIRNDFYLTIKGGTFDRGGKKTARNIEVSIMVFDQSGQQIQDAIYPGSSGVLSVYKSVVYYQTASPLWMETVKVCLTMDQLKEGHIVFLFKHRSSMEENDVSQKPFSFSYLRLMQSDLTPLLDCEHKLMVYKYEKSVFEEHSYLSWPSVCNDPDRSSTMTMSRSITSLVLPVSSREVFLVNTLLCSTSFTQNRDLLDLFRWSSQVEKLQQILANLCHVDGEEIMKFLLYTFDALFNILSLHSGHHGVSVFNALVFCTGLLSERKFANFRTVIDTYLQDYFSAVQVHVILVPLLEERVRSGFEGAMYDAKRVGLLKLFRSLEYLIKFICRSRQLYDRHYSLNGREEFRNSIQSLLESFTMLLASPDADPSIKGSAMKYIHTILGDLLEYMDASKLGQFCHQFLTALPQDQQRMGKLFCIQSILKTALFLQPAARHWLISLVFESIHLENSDEISFCGDIVISMLQIMSKPASDIGSIDNDMQFIVRNYLTHFIFMVMSLDRTQELGGKYVACLICLLDMMSKHHYQIYIEQFPTPEKLKEVASAILLLFIQLLTISIFREDWMEMVISQNRVILKAIDYISPALKDYFLVGESFEIQLWSNYFNLCVAFANQPCFLDTKRRKFHDRHSEMCLEIGRKIVSMWNILGSHKRKLISSMICPFLELSLLPQLNLRQNIIPLFYDIIHCSYHANGGYRETQLTLIEHLDVLMGAGKGDEEYMSHFRDILLPYFLKDEDLHHQGEVFISEIVQQMDHLLIYRAVIKGEENKNYVMSCLMNIMNFYRERKLTYLYVKYLYKLYDLHVQMKNFTEAGFCLRVHADLLKWSDSPPPAFSQLRYKASTEKELKELLYREIIEKYDQGEMWEYGIRLCKELAEQYENEVYDYKKLSDILVMESDLFQKILNRVRMQHSYYLVSFSGLGFPAFLRDKEYIYRGDPCEMHGQFKLTLQSIFHMAIIDPKGSDIVSSYRQYIHTYPVKAKPVDWRKFQGRKVPSQVTDFYAANHIQQFTFMRKIKDKGGDDVGTLWTELTTLETDDCFPFVLRWSRVKSKKTEELSPIQNAVLAVTAKTKEVETLVHKLELSLASIFVNNLSMIIDGVVNAFVSGGVKNYIRCFLNPSYIEKNQADIPEIKKLVEILEKQKQAVSVAMSFHARMITDDQKDLHNSFVESFKDYKQTIEKVAEMLTETLADISRKKGPPVHPPPVRQSLSSSSQAIHSSSMLTSSKDSVFFPSPSNAEDSVDVVPPSPPPKPFRSSAVSRGSNPGASKTLRDSSASVGSHDSVSSSSRSSRDTQPFSHSWSFSYSPSSTNNSPGSETLKPPPPPSRSRESCDLSFFEGESSVVSAEPE